MAEYVDKRCTQAPPTADMPVR